VAKSWFGTRRAVLKLATRPRKIEVSMLVVQRDADQTVPIDQERYIEKELLMSTAKVGFEARPPVPPFTRESAELKVRRAEDLWNTRDPEKVVFGYTQDSRWRNRAEFVNGSEEIVTFLKRKWSKELEYRLIKEVWAFGGDRIAVRFAYEWHDDSNNWFRSYGNENWEFDENGLTRLRFACINDLPIKESDRKYRWTLGRRPDDHPGLSELGL
jgi:nuclear transport factor 2 (NTF2) superfamily protein